MSDWQPIETAPKDGTAVLLNNARQFVRYAPYVGSYREGVRSEPGWGVVGWRADCCGRFTEPTHWMPLPEPPKEDA